MADSDGNVKVNLRKYMERHPINGLTWIDQPGAETLKVAVENAISQERGKHYWDPWAAGSMNCVKPIYDRVADMMKESPQALAQVANARGYYYAQTPQADPHFVYKTRFAKAPGTPRGEWEKSKYDHLQNVGNDYTMDRHASVRSRHADLPDPPLKANGDIDYDKISVMTGHKPYNGPGAASSPRILSQPNNPYKSRF
jgi:hypothetical protein